MSDGDRRRRVVLDVLLIVALVLALLAAVSQVSDWSIGLPGSNVFQ